MELTNGEKAAGVGFNPSKDPFVDKIKKMYADIIDEMDKFRRENGATPEKARYASKAISYAEDSQMNVVKAITWQH